MTAQALFESDAEFRGFVLLWAKKRCAPIPFVDWLNERGYPKMADCVAWCAAQPLRLGLNKRAHPRAVHPRQSRRQFHFFASMYEACRGFHKIPDEYVPGCKKNRFMRAPTEEGAILILLSEWQPLPEGK